MKQTRETRLQRAQWGVYVILDPTMLSAESDIFEWTQAVMEGGCRVLQLRDKVSAGNELVARSRGLKRIVERYRGLLIVNDRLDVALVAGADGVHLGPDDIAVEDARRLAPELIIGASAGEVARAKEMIERGADYLGVGAIYGAHESKPNASAPRGVQVLKDMRTSLQKDIPLIAIGGITAETAPAVIEAGAQGVAVIRAVARAADPELATREMAKSIELPASRL